MTRITTNDAIGDATDALQRLDSWMQAKVHPLAQPEHDADWQRWQRELQSIRESLARPQAVQVALVGTTGAGKSTLLNSLLGVQLLQVGVATSITSFVTLVRFAAGPGYQVEIDYSTREEWLAEVERFIKALEPGEDDGDGEARNIVNNLRRRVEASMPLGRIGQPEEVAEPILWLLSDKASLVTGANINAGGGGFLVAGMT